MVFEHIEKLKREYTDKYVVVSEEQPELRRFIGQTGQVKTVNMSGRALVQFNAYENIGWYDIEVDFLKIVPKPLPQEPEKPKAAVKKSPTAAKQKRTSAPSTQPSGGLSASDILAAARGSGAAPAQKPAAKAGEMSAADVLAAARGGDRAQAAAAPEAPKTDVASMSAADILAAARGGTQATPAAEPPPTPKAAASVTDTPPAEPSSEEPSVSLNDLPTDAADIIAWCQQRDA